MLEKKKIRYPYKRRTWAFNKVGIFYLLLWKRKFKTRNLDVLNSSTINQGSMLTTSTIAQSSSIIKQKLQIVPLFAMAPI